MLRETLFAVAAAGSAAMITIGAWTMYPPVGWIIGGVLLALWSWAVLARVADR